MLWLKKMPSLPSGSPPSPPAVSSYLFTEKAFDHSRQILRTKLLANRSGLLPPLLPPLTSDRWSLSIRFRFYLFGPSFQLIFEVKVIKGFFLPLLSSSRLRCGMAQGLFASSPLDMFFRLAPSCKFHREYPFSSSLPDFFHEGSVRSQSVPGSFRKVRYHDGLAPEPASCRQ